MLRLGFTKGTRPLWFTVRHLSCTGHRPSFTDRLPATTTVMDTATAAGGVARTGEATDTAMAGVRAGNITPGIADVKRAVYRGVAGVL